MNCDDSRTRFRSRRGAAIVEAAVVLGVFLTILIGSLDLALAILRNNTLAEAARRLARAAIVHGEDSAAIHTPWGPATASGVGSDPSEFAAAMRDVLVLVDPTDVQFQLVWPDGGNSSGDRVTAVVTSSYQPILTSLFGSRPYELRAASTMRIEH